MMSGAKKMVPKRRFKEFLNTGSWEQRKFGELMTFLNGRAYKQDELLRDGMYKVLRVGNFYTNDSWYYSDLELDDKYYAKNGDLLYTWSATFGPHIWKGEKVIYHYHIWKLVLQDKIDKLFALQLLEVDKASIISDKNGSTMVHITKQGMENKQTILPISLNEQKRIAKFLSSMDNLITLHQLKLDKLEATKKALLQEMFPEEGQDKPKRRFKGFTDAWEQRKLLTVLNKIVDYRGRTPKKLGLDWSPTGHLALSALNVKMGYVDKTIDAHYGDDHLYSVWMKDNDLYEGQVLFTTEAPMGNVAQVPDNNKYILSQRTIAFVPDRSVISDNFLAVVLSASKCQKSLINRASGGTAKGVSQKTLSEISLDIPQSLSEQDKVSELIKKLSKIITLHQRKLDKLNNLKQAYLNEMFV